MIRAHHAAAVALRLALPGAMVAVQRWSFRPARRAGRPIAAWLHVGVAFEDPGDAAKSPDTLAKAPR